MGAAPPPVAGGIGEGWRLYRGFLVARAVLGVALVLAHFAGLMLGNEAPAALLGLSTLYAALTMAQALTPSRQRPDPRAVRLTPPQWWGSAGVDLIAFSLLQALGGGAGPPVAALFVLPVMLSAVLVSRRAGLAAAAAATLGSLAASFWTSLRVTDWGAPITQAGLAGIGYFVIALLAAELAARLAREQQAASGSMALARQQIALNQLVIDEMQEGVLVVDPQLGIRAANPAARTLLGGVEVPGSLLAESAWSGLAGEVRKVWQAGAAAQPKDVVLALARAPARTLRLRVRWMRDGAADELLVLLLEDRAKLLARARQEKLAAMGRMSAGIAHEIRNPLAAISQANALLGEDLAGDAGGQRLTELVASNVRRLQRIVDEVMVLAGPVEGTPPAMDAVAVLQEVADDWSRTQCATCLQLQLPDRPLAVLFEPEHLRRVLVNLLDNGWRHVQAGGPRWLRLTLSATDEQSAVFELANPSEPLPAQVEQHLFEPFYSTRSRGSGLGLYICRELCERYGARIDYQARPVDGTPSVVFAVTLRRAPTSSPPAP